MVHQEYTQVWHDNMILYQDFSSLYIPDLHSGWNSYNQLCKYCLI